MGMAAANPTEVTPGTAAELIGDLVLLLRNPARIRDEQVRNENMHGLQVIWIGKPRLNVTQCREGANHEQGANQKNKSHGDLGDDQHIP